MSKEQIIPWYRKLSVKILIVLLVMFVGVMVSHHLLILGTFKSQMKNLKSVIEKKISNSGNEIVKNLEDIGEMFLALNTQKVFYELLSYLNSNDTSKKIKTSEELIKFLTTDDGVRNILSAKFLDHGYCTSSVYEKGKLFLAYHPKTSLQEKNLFDVIKNLSEEAKKKQNIERFAAHWSMRQSGCIEYEQTGTFMPENIPEGWKKKIAYQHWGNFNGVEFVVEMSTYVREFSAQIEKVLEKQRELKNKFDSEIRKTRKSFVEFFVWISVIFLMGILIFYLYFRKLIIIPIKKIVVALKRFAREEFNDPMDLNKKDEFQIIEDNSNQMVKRLSQTLLTLEKLNQELESKVEERTSELKFSNDELEKSRQKSEKLLMNVLPESIATRLMENPETVIADDYAQVTVLFTDFKGFTPMSETVPPEKLVRELSDIFAEFDKFAGDGKMEKIKTIGDAYMAAGGLPIKNSTHPIDAVKLGLKMIAYIGKRASESGKMPLQIRIGIHSGPVIAGVIGKSKFSYDLWGDTVNIASRMESSGTPGKVTMSEGTYKLIKEHFNCKDRGNVEVKGKGKMKIYEVVE